jgi:hypothetical protein
MVRFLFLALVSLAVPVAWAQDVTPPTVLSTNPVAYTNTEPLTVTPTVTFSEAMDPASLISANVKLLDGATEVPLTLSYNSGTHVLTLTPTTTLSYSHMYTMQLSTAVRDVATNPLAATYTAPFNATAGPTVNPAAACQRLP